MVGFHREPERAGGKLGQRRLGVEIGDRAERRAAQWLPARDRPADGPSYNFV